MFHYKKQIALIIFLISSSLFAQIGVGTTAPKAAMDITSTNQGFLMPRIALSATNVATLINPSGGALETGTMVFNIGSTSGTYAVYPGVYYWDGTNWVSQTHRYFQKNFTQSSDLVLASSASTYTNVPGLVSQTFIAPYSGQYNMVFTGYLGAGTVDNDASKMGFVEGNFKFTVNGVDYRKYSHSTSFYNSNTSTNYLELFNESNINVNVFLTAGQTCTINGSYNGVADDNIDNAHPHIVGKSSLLGNNCEVNIMYLGR